MDEKKYIKYTIETINDKDDLELGKSFKEMVMEAVKHALKEGIKANSIIINKDFVRVKKSWIINSFSYSELPDMICGLEVYLTDNDLPENYSFAVVEKSQTKREHLIEKTKIDTAREILQKMKEKCKELEYKFSHICKSKKECLMETCRYEGVLAVKRELYELAKKYGVEVEE